MRAVRYDRWGPPDGLHVVDDIAEPQPGAGEVLVRIEAASLNPLDWKLCAGALRHVPGAKNPPRTTGCDFAGVIAAVGPQGKLPWRPGDRVFGMLSPFGREGSCAERCVVGALRIAAIPDGVSFETAACLPIAAGEAVQALADEARLAAGQRLLIVGAAGGVGHFAVQFARHIGARVTGVCGAGNLDFVKRELGADEVVDYRSNDLRTLGKRFDVVFDVAGALDWRSAAAHLLVRGGVYLATGGTTSAAIATGVGRWAAPWLHGTRARNVMLAIDPVALRRLGELATRGVLRPQIRRRIGLDEVAEALAAMLQGHAQGKVVVLPVLAAER
jgi:NADPH:quinone reductase-like Zn-dependent oxidoreductase